MNKGKKYVENSKKRNSDVAYSPKDALEVCLSMANAKFDETIELHARLGVDSRHADQQVRGAVVLPNGTGKRVRVLAICKGDDEKSALEAGADFVGCDDYVSKIQSGWFDFDVLVTTPNMMATIGKLGKILGPKGLMPNPKAGTVSDDIGKAVSDVKAGKIEYRLDKNNIIHSVIGKAFFGVDKLLENFDTLMGAIVKSRPEAAKGQYVRSCYIASTMSPSVRISVSKFN